MARVGIVLGAGGVAGGAWHAAALAALAEVAGWDARRAEVVVGTSAGSISGALLRAGLAPADHYAGAIGRPLSAEGRRITARVRSTPFDFARGGRSRLRMPANPALVRALLPWNSRPAVAIAGLLPPGVVDGTSIGARVEEAAGGPAWPAASLWVVAVRLSDGARVAFGRDDGGGGPPPLGAAVSASSAIPGFFAPVEIGGQRFVDGGVHSTTNADLTAGLGLDLVVVSAPMAGRWRSLRAHPAALARTSARVALDREVAAVRKGGTPVLVLQPGPEDTPLMDGRSMDPGARAPVARQARRTIDAALARPEVADLVARLRG